MARKNNGITFGNAFNIVATAPIDSRMLVEHEADLWNKLTWPDDKAPIFQGMTVTVAETGAVWVLKNVEGAFVDITDKEHTGWVKLATASSAGNISKELAQEIEDRKAADVAYLAYSYTYTGEEVAKEAKKRADQDDVIELNAGLLPSGKYNSADAANHTLIAGSKSIHEATTKLADKLAAANLDEVKGVGLPIVSISQVDGKVTAAPGDIAANHVTVTEMGVGVTTVQQALENLKTASEGVDKKIDDKLNTAYTNKYASYFENTLNDANTHANSLITALTYNKSITPGKVLSAVKLNKGALEITETDLAAQHVTFDNTASGLTATNVKAAIDEVEERIQHLEEFKDGDDIKITGYQGQFLTGFEKKDGKVISTYFAYSHMKDIQVDGNGWTQISTKSETLKDALDSVDAKLAKINGEGAGSIKKAYSDIVGGADEYHNTLGKLQNKVIAAKTVINDKSDEHVHITGKAQVDGHMLYTLEENDIASANALASEVAKRATDDAAIANAVGLDTTSYAWTQIGAVETYGNAGTAATAHAAIAAAAQETHTNTAAIGELNTELTNTGTAAFGQDGLSKEGQYVKYAGNYINTADSLYKADAILDTKVKEAIDAAGVADGKAVAAQADADTANNNLGKVKNEVGLTNSYDYTNPSSKIFETTDTTVKANITKLGDTLSTKVLGDKNINSGAFTMPTFKNITTSTDIVNALENVDTALGNIKGTSYGADIAKLNSHQGELAESITGDKGTYIYEPALGMTHTKSKNIKGAIKELDKAITDVNGDITSLTKDLNGLNLLKTEVTKEDPTNVAYYVELFDLEHNSKGKVAIYKDKSLISSKLGHSGAKLIDGGPEWSDGSGAEALIFVYQLADGKYELVEIDLGTFLTQSEFKNGLQVIGSEVSVKLSESTENPNDISKNNKNFLVLEGETDGEKSMAVREIDANRAKLPKAIRVAGLQGTLGTGKWGNGDTIPAGTDIYQLLVDILSQEIYPKPVYTEGEISWSLADPVITAESIVEYDTPFTASITWKNIDDSSTANDVTGLTNGYSTVVSGGSISKASLKKSWSSKVSDKWMFTGSINGQTLINQLFNATSKSVPSAVKTTMNLFSTQIGANTINVEEIAPIVSATCQKIDPVYIVSNLGNRVPEQVTKEVTAKSNSAKNLKSKKSATVKGAYPCFTNIDGGTIKAGAKTKLDIQESATFMITVPAETSAKVNFEFYYEASRHITEFKVKDLEGEYVPNDKAYDKDILVEAFDGSHGKKYKKLVTKDGFVGISNYKIILSAPMTEDGSDVVE